MSAKGIIPVEPLPPIRARTGIVVPRMVWIVLGLYLFSMLAGAGVFLTAPEVRVGGDEFSTDRAVFVALNCGTLTGFSYTVGMNDFNPDNSTGPIVSLSLTVIGVLATLIMGGLAAVRALRLPYRDGQVIASAVTATVLAALGGAIVLGVGQSAGSYGMLDAIFQAVCAFGNCGLVKGRMSELAGWRLQVVLLPLAIAGGAGLPVLMELYNWVVNRKPISRHSAITIVALAAAYLIGMAGMLLFVWPTEAIAIHPLAIHVAELRSAIGGASALSLDTRSLGFPLSIDALSRPGQWWLVLLMAVGAGSAGTAGGIKLTNLIVLGRGVRRSLRGEQAGETATKVFGIAVAWLGCYLVIAVACWVALLQLEPQIPADRLAFLSVSATSNVGLATETVSIVKSGIYVLSGAMLLGRLMPIAMLWWMARAAAGTELLAA